MTIRKTLKGAAIVGAFAMLVGVMGCSSETPPPPPATGTPLAQANFDLQKCQQLQANLYKCPAIDQPLCTPEFNRSDINCVHIGPNGAVYIQRQGMGM